MRFGKSFEPSPTPKNTEAFKPILVPTPNSYSDVVVETEKEKQKEYVSTIPFPQRVVKSKNMDEEDKENEIMDIFMKVALNIPLLGVIKQIPKYAKFLKDLSTHKRKLKVNERVNMGRNAPTFIQPKVPEKVTTE